MKEEEKFAEIVKKIIDVNPGVVISIKLIEMLIAHVSFKGKMIILKKSLNGANSPLSKEFKIDHEASKRFSQN